MEIEVKIPEEKSSLISNLLWNEKELSVTFRTNNVTYIYEKVPMNIFLDVLNSSSIGSYFGHFIKGSFIYRKVEKDENNEKSN